MGISRLQFILFYSVFLLFVVFVSGMAGISLITGSTGAIYSLPEPTGVLWVDWTLPFTYFWTMLNISAEYAIIFTLIIMPFIIGLIVTIAEMIRGN